MCINRHNIQDIKGGVTPPLAAEPRTCIDTAQTPKHLWKEYLKGSRRDRKIMCPTKSELYY